MPSVFVLDGPRLGAIAVPLRPGGYPEYGGRSNFGKPKRGQQVQSVFAQITNPVPTMMGSLGQAVSVGFGEISSGTKTGLLALGVLGVVGLVAYSGSSTARRRGRTLFGSRRRRRRRR